MAIHYWTGSAHSLKLKTELLTGLLASNSSLTRFVQARERFMVARSAHLRCGFKNSQTCCYLSIWKSPLSLLRIRMQTVFHWSCSIFFLLCADSDLKSSPFVVNRSKLSTVKHGSVLICFDLLCDKKTHRVSK